MLLVTTKAQALLLLSRIGPFTFDISFVAVRIVGLGLITALLFLFLCALLRTLCQRFGPDQLPILHLFGHFHHIYKPNRLQTLYLSLSLSPNHGMSPFMKVFSNISLINEVMAHSLSNGFIYSSTIDSCLIARNWLHTVPCRGGLKSLKKSHLQCLPITKRLPLLRATPI